MTYQMRKEFLFKTDSGYPRDACGRCDVDMGQVRDTKVHVTLSLMRYNSTSRISLQGGEDS